MGETVEFPSSGGLGAGYLATAVGGAGPGLIVIHEWWGLVDHVKNVCDRFTIEGFTALAPDLYRGRSVPGGDPDEAAATMMAMDIERAGDDLSAAVDYLRAHPEVRGRGVGVVGFSMGGGLALWLATMRPDEVRAVVPFYGFIPWEAAQPDFASLGAPVQGHCAADDDLAGPEAARALEQRLHDLGKEVQVHVYPGTYHAFFDDTRTETYDEDAARQAWIRTLEFLRANLG